MGQPGNGNRQADDCAVNEGIPEDRLLNAADLPEQVQNKYSQEPVINIKPVGDLSQEAEQGAFEPKQRLRVRGDVHDENDEENRIDLLVGIAHGLTAIEEDE